jgi:hypothetical protein
MNIQPNSWHFWLYSKMTDRDYEDMRYYKPNFCQYSRMVLWGILISILGVGLGLFVISSLVCFYASFFMNDAYFVVGKVLLLPGFLAVMGGVIHIAAAIVGLLTAIRKHIDKYRERKWEERYGPNPTPEEPGFFATWYSANKHKWCPSLEFGVRAE